MKKELIELKKTYYLLNATYTDAAKIFGVNPFEFKVLHLIFLGHGELTQKQLVIYTNEIKQVVHNVINKFKNEGLVELKVDPIDKRKKRIELTKKGLDIWDERYDSIIKLEEKDFEQFTKEEIAISISFMKKYTKYLQEHLGEIKNEK